jgi:hypothetical protein
MVNMFDRGGTGVVCGFNTIKLKHKRCFGGKHCFGCGGASAETATLHHSLEKHA